MEKDKIFQEDPQKWGGFQFDEKVTRVFDDMLNRSIPQYQELQQMIMDLVDIFYQKNSTIYDLGCSLGTLMGKIHLTFGDRITRQVGIDNSPSMIEKADSLLSKTVPGAPIELVCSDINDLELNDASIVIMNYTLQFVRPIFREKLLKNIFSQLKPGGILILSEKVLEDSQEISHLFHDLYYRFKMRNGYTATEIARKRACLEHVLVPYKASEHMQLLEETGFKSVQLFHKWFNFASFLAVKE